MNHRTNSGTTAELQPLEPRRFLDGNVTANLSNGNLTLTGDSEENVIRITKQSSGKFRIKGFDDTTVNDKEAISIGPVANDLVIQMTQGGADTISLQGALTILGDLNAQLGEGEFLIEGSAGVVHVVGDVNIETGEDGIANIRNEVVIDGSTSIVSGSDAYIVTAGAIVPDFDLASFSDSLNIDNPYFPVVPGTEYVYHTRGVDDDTDEEFTERNVITIDSQTKTVNGVEVRIFHDRVYEDDLLMEDTEDWFAQDDNGNVWYFGESVLNYDYDEDGNVIETNTHGSWTAGVNGAQAGIVMDAEPRVGLRYFQEYWPGNVLDAAMGLSTRIKVKVPAGTFRDVYRSEETNVTEPDALEWKQYAPGVGIIGEFGFDSEDNEIVEASELISLKLNGQTVTQVVSPTGFSGTNVNGRLVGGAELDDVSIESDAVAIINGVHFGNDVAIDSSEAAILINSELDAGAEIDAAESVTLRDVFASGSILISGDADVFVFDSNLDRLALRMGARGNDVTIRDSVIDRLDAYGGGGHNQLFDQGGNDIDSSRVRKFNVFVP